MFARTCIIGSWKHHRWKNVNKLYSTLSKFLHAHLPCIISRNIEIACLAKSGELDAARKLFEEMPIRTVVTWNTMITGYANWGFYTESINLVSSMHRSQIKLNDATVSTVLSVCSHSQSLSDGKLIHCLVLKYGLQRFQLVGSALLYFYARCYKIHEARCVFDELHGSNDLVWSVMLVGYVKCNLMDEAFDVFMRMPSQDVVSWTTLISGCSRSYEGCEKALHLFRRMRENGEMRPNEFTLDCVLRACVRLGMLHEGRGVHGLVVRFGFEFDQSIASALIGLYCTCEAVDDGQRVYDGLFLPCLNASNSLIEGYVLLGRIEDAEQVFEGLVERNPVSYNLMIKGYAMSGRVDDSKKLFGRMPLRTIASVNTMISVYSWNDEIEDALRLFDEIKGERNSVTWNSMISGYIQNDQPEEAIKLYQTMHRLSIDRTRSTFSALFHACSCLGSLQQGKLVHGHLIKTPFQSNVYVGTSLVDMYAKCGSIYDSQTSFNCILLPNVAAWTALISGYAHHGLFSQALVLFEEMLQQGIDPNGATFVGILFACGCAGMVNEGMNIFLSMQKCFGVTPTLEHYACMVDLLGRSGHLEEAKQLIVNMPIEADAIILGALLSACCSWMDIEMGERVARQMFTLDSKSISGSIIMSNIYARLGRWGEKIGVRNCLTGLEVKKMPGCSWIELNNSVHAFSAEDRTHPHCNLIYATLENLIANANLSLQCDDGHQLVTEAGGFLALCVDY